MHYSAPQLRQSTANILTDIGWFAATFHVPQHQSLVDFLAGGVGVIKATRVRIPGEESRLPFVGIRRDSMLLVDGGLLSNIPVSVARGLGCDIVIVVNTTSPLQSADHLGTPGMWPTRSSRS